MSDIEKSQRAFMDGCDSNCCNHQCNEGRNCENELPGIDWMTVAIYGSSAVTASFVIGSAVVFMRWLLS